MPWISRVQCQVHRLRLPLARTVHRNPHHPGVFFKSRSGVDQSDQKMISWKLSETEFATCWWKECATLIYFMSKLRTKRMSTTMPANRWESFPCEKKRLHKLVIHVIFETGDLPSLELTVRPLQNGAGRETAVLLGIAPIFRCNLLVSGLCSDVNLYEETLVSWTFFLFFTSC